MSRNKIFADYTGEYPHAGRLTDIPGYRKSESKCHPDIERGPAAMRDLYQTTDAGTPLGIDLEFSIKTLRPTIVAITTLDRIAVSVWNAEAKAVITEAFEKGFLWVAHSGLSADKPVVEKSCSIETPLRIWRDSMVTHWLTNMHLSKAPGKSESEDSGALGFMDLWTTTSLTSDMYNWKECQGAACEAADLPCPIHDPEAYCGIDAWGGLNAWVKHQVTLKKNNVPEWLELETLRLIEICEEMKQAGVKVDLHAARLINYNIEVEKEEIFPVNPETNQQEPFNPRSNPKVLAWFNANGLALRKNDKDTIRKELDKAAGRFGMVTPDNETDMEALEEADDLPPVLDALYRCWQYKEAGKGLDPWFGEKYLDEKYHILLKKYKLTSADSIWSQDAAGVWGVQLGAERLWDDLQAAGYVHSRLVGVGTSTGRLSSSNPNFQNVAVRGFGELVRRCIVPRSADLDLLKSDFSQLELRMCLYLAGVDQKAIGKDAFTWLVEESKGGFSTAAERAASDERQIAKSVSHGGDYLEGIKLLHPADLDKLSVQREIKAGALRVYLKKFTPMISKDWLFRGKVVCFTGANLAERLFGDRTLANRAKALEIQEDIYFKNFFFIREWQMRVLDSVQDSGIIRSPVGHYMKLYGTDEDWAKISVAYLGQGVSAAHVQGIMLKAPQIPLLQVHDELVFEIPTVWTNQQALEFIAFMQTETHRLPGFSAPGKVYRGKNWLEYKPKKHGPYNGRDLVQIG